MLIFAFRRQFHDGALVIGGLLRPRRSGMDEILAGVCGRSLVADHLPR
ncbi:MAG: hypothetical protein WA624_19885 [Methylocella sp.]